MSRASGKRNGTGPKSVGKVSSQGGNSFAQASGTGFGITAKSANTGAVGPNIVIDIESENLTYN